MLGDKDQKHHMVHLPLFLSVWRRHDGFLIFTERSVHLAGHKGGLDCAALPGCEIKAHSYTQGTVQRSYGVELVRLGRVLEVEAKDWRAAEALVRLLKNLSESVRSWQ